MKRIWACPIENYKFLVIDGNWRTEVRWLFSWRWCKRGALNYLHPISTKIDDLCWRHLLDEMLLRTRTRRFTMRSVRKLRTSSSTIESIDIRWQLWPRDTMQRTIRRKTTGLIWGRFCIRCSSPGSLKLLMIRWRCWRKEPPVEAVGCNWNVW